MSCPAHGLAASRFMLVPEDVDLIGEAVGLLPTDRIVFVVDLGTGSGTTALSAFAALPEGLRLLSVDNDDKNLFWGSRAVENIGRKGDFQAVKGDVLWASASVPDGEVDLLLVDCMPDETEGILRAWLPKLHPDGYIWVHDYGDPKEFGEPFNAQDKNEAVAAGVATLIAEGALTEVKVAGLGWLGQLVDGWSAPKLAEDPAKISDTPTAEVEPEPSDGKPAGGEPTEPDPAAAPEAPQASPEPEEQTKAEEPADATEEPKRKPGRPPGAKNIPKE